MKRVYYRVHNFSCFNFCFKACCSSSLGCLLVKRMEGMGRIRRYRVNCNLLQADFYLLWFWFHFLKPRLCLIFLGEANLSVTSKFLGIWPCCVRDDSRWVRTMGTTGKSLAILCHRLTTGFLVDRFVWYFSFPTKLGIPSKRDIHTIYLWGRFTFPLISVLPIPASSCVVLGG